MMPLSDEELASIEQDADAGLADNGWSLIGADEVKRLVAEVRQSRKMIDAFVDLVAEIKRLREEISTELEAHEDE